jgi:beta-N-acetylhexosaminidase
MEGRLPPEDEELFEWTDSPARPPPRDQGTGERGRKGSGEGERVEPRRREGPRLRLGGRRPRRPRPDTAERRAVRGETGEFERSGRRPPPGRRARRRDLPARVRRRQDAVIGAVALVLVIALIVAVTGGGGGTSEPEIGLKRLVGQTIVAKLGRNGADQDLLRRIRQGRVGGLIAFPRNVQSLRADVQEAQAAAKQGGNPPLLVMVDQEGGGVKRLPDGPPDLSPRQLGAAGDEGESKSQGQETGAYLKGLGLNADLAPVLDISEPTTARKISSRTFGTDPEVVSSIGVAFAEGLQDGGVVSSPKHFPGLGRATVTTDEQPVTIAATSAELQTDIEPFRAAVEAGVDMVMVSSASYPGLTPGSNQPAVFSPQIVKGQLRDPLGFDGVVITDDLEAPAVEASPGDAGALALQAGDDLLLYAKSTGGSDQALKTLVSQVKEGALDRGLISSAYDRITSLKENLP